jgi:hypothetical protein
VAWRTGTERGRGMGCPPTGAGHDRLSRCECSSQLPAKLRVAIARHNLMSRDIRNTTRDFDDAGEHDGSIGVRFAAGHEGNLGSPFLSDIANAYVLMHPGNALVHNH